MFDWGHIAAPMCQKHSRIRILMAYCAQCRKVSKLGASWCHFVASLRPDGSLRTRASLQSSLEAISKMSKMSNGYRNRFRWEMMRMGNVQSMRWTVRWPLHALVGMSKWLLRFRGIGHEVDERCQFTFENPAPRILWLGVDGSSTKRNVSYTHYTLTISNSSNII